MASLRDKTLSGIYWSFLQKVGSRGIAFIVMILLARLLTPKDFGLIGMLTIVIQISQSIVNSGFKQALIQDDNVDEEDFSTAFYLNLSTSILLYSILFFVSPLIADFYSQPLLTELTRVLALLFVVNAFSYVQDARLTKQMDFRKLMIIQLPSTLFAGTVSVIMAYWGMGVWSLIFYQLVSRLAYAAQIWLYAKWKPLIVFNKQKARRLFSFGSNLMISTIINTLYRNLYLVVIGKFFSLQTVGYYQNANNLIYYPSHTIGSIINNVTFSSFSRIKNDDEKLREAYKNIVHQLLFWLVPVFISVAIFASPLVRILFTEKWEASVPYIRFLCVVGIFFPVNNYNLHSIVNIKGHANLFLRLEIWKKVLTVGAVIFIIPYGIFPLLIFQAIICILEFLLNSYYSGKFIKYSLGCQLIDLFPIIMLNVALGLIMLLLNYNMGSASDIVRVLAGFTLGVSFYLLTAHIFKVAPYMYIKQIVESRLALKKQNRY